MLAAGLEMLAISGPRRISASPREADYNGRRRFLAALDELTGAAPAIQNERLRWLGMARANALISGVAAETALDHLAALHNLSIALAVMCDRTFLHSAPVVPEHWHSVAVILAEEFCKAMLSTNSKRPRYSNDGPVAGFLAKAIPDVTGETPTRHAVARYLQRSSRQVTTQHRTRYP